MKEYIGASYLSASLGVSLTSIHNWRNAPHNDFPEAVATTRGRTGKQSTFSWEVEQITEIRAWYAKRFKLTEAAANIRWAQIDFKLGDQLHSAAPAKTEDICPGQDILFPVPQPGIAVAA